MGVHCEEGRGGGVASLYSPQQQPRDVDCIGHYVTLVLTSREIGEQGTALWVDAIRAGNRGRVSDSILQHNREQCRRRRERCRYIPSHSHTNPET